MLEQVVSHLNQVEQVITPNLSGTGNAGTQGEQGTTGNTDAIVYTNPLINCNIILIVLLYANLF